MPEIKEIKISEENYPLSLKTVPQPPKTVFYQGKIAKEEKAVAIVGTRIPSDYGRQAAWKISQELLDYGLVIVSGLAPGIDTICHQAAVENNKRTVAVLGTGLDEKSFYPAANLGLAKKIIENNGCLLSEYPAGTRGTKYTFPQRNRLVAGLSLAVVVIEAKERSGALITAGWAEKMKKKVFAVPGNVYSTVSGGPNLLIKTGKAILARNGQDIIEGLGIEKQEQQPTAGNRLANEEQLIVECLKAGPLEIEKIIEKTKLPARKVVAALTVLETEKEIRNLGRGVFGL